jgi:hypothetical protein
LPLFAAFLIGAALSCRPHSAPAEQSQTSVAPKPTTKPTADVLDDIIAAISKTEQRVRTVHVESFDLTVEEAADAKSDFKPTPKRYQGSAWFDMGDGLSSYGWARARVRFDSLVMEWEDGAAPWFDQETDVSFDGSRGRSIQISGRSLPDGTRHRDNAAWTHAEPPPLLCDPGLRQACGLEFTLWWSQDVSRPPEPPRTSRQPQFARYLAECQQNGNLPQIGHERVNDVDTVRLRWESELSDTDGKSLRTVRTWWLDPARGYSLIRRERTSSNTRLVRRLDVTELIEAAPGVWYPTAGVIEDVAFGTCRVNDPTRRARERRHFTVTGIRINEPIQDALFSPTIPPGYVVIDSGKAGEMSIVQPDATTRPMRDVEVRPRARPGTLERPH